MACGNAIVSQRAYLCTGNNDWFIRSIPLTAKPITIKERAWVGASSVIGASVTAGRNAIFRIGSVVINDIPPRHWTIKNDGRIGWHIGLAERINSGEMEKSTA